MTNGSLRRRLIAVLILIVALLIASVEEQNYFDSHNISSNSTLIALLFAGYMTYVFQQRGKFVDDLRRWWNEIVAAKSAFFVYCDKSNPSEDDFFQSFYKLSTAMDTLRLIYCNVGRNSKNPKGYYPFEQVRDIIDVARSVAPGRTPSSAERSAAKSAINLIFQSLRHAIQDEAKASAPDKPTLYSSEYRITYMEEIHKNISIDIEDIRAINKNEDYVSRREKS